MLIDIDWGSDLMSTMGKATMFSWTASEMGTGWGLRKLARRAQLARWDISRHAWRSAVRLC